MIKREIWFIYLITVTNTNFKSFVILLLSVNFVIQSALFYN